MDKKVKIILRINLILLKTFIPALDSAFHPSKNYFHIFIETQPNVFGFCTKTNIWWFVYYLNERLCNSYI